MLIAFFDSKGLIYTHIVPRGVAINANYIIKALVAFRKHLLRKRPLLVEQEWFLHWDNAPVHSAAVVQDWLAAHNIWRLNHPPYLPDLAPMDFFLFPKVKEQLSGLHLDQDSLKTTWEGVTKIIAKEEFAAAFRRWYKRCKKCVRIGGDYVEKS
jgi:[histone H3]-lysine36 N-dimethyltransferase SETMAR